MLPSEILKPHRPAGERVSWCLETSPPSQLPPQVGSPSLTLVSLFLSFIFCPTSFWREWAAFPGVWCLPPAFRSCFVEFAQCSNDLSMNLWGRKWSPHPIPLPCLDHPQKMEFKLLFFKTPFLGWISIPTSFVSLFIFCPTSFWRQWAAFLGAWCPPPAFRSCFVEFAWRSNDLSMNLWGRRWSPHPIPPPSSMLWF